MNKDFNNTEFEKYFKELTKFRRDLSKEMLKHKKQLKYGVNVELEHFEHFDLLFYNPVNRFDLFKVVVFISLAHLREFDDYYKRLFKMENQ